jgi:hypothetical protein
VEIEYQRVRKLNKRKPVWHELYNGPKNIEKLAEYLKLIGLYQILYRNLSKSTHGKNIIDGYISPGEKKGEVNFSQIRAPYSAQMICQFTFTISFQIYKSIIDFHLPQYKKAYAVWYRDEVSEFYLKLSKENLLVVK